jgi:hypothetical protein
MTPVAHSWTPEDLEAFEAKIEAARAGDVHAAASLLRRFVHCLESDLPLPEPLRRYLIDAFREITKTSPADLATPPWSGPIRNKNDLRKFSTRVEETRDANTALNLRRPRGRKHSAARAMVESWWLAGEVRQELEAGAKSLEAAVAAVADRIGVSDRTVSRACKKMGPLHRNK